MTKVDALLEEEVERQNFVDIDGTPGNNRLLGNINNLESDSSILREDRVSDFAIKSDKFRKGPNITALEDSVLRNCAGGTVKSSNFISEANLGKTCVGLIDHQVTKDEISDETDRTGFLQSFNSPKRTRDDQPENETETFPKMETAEIRVANLEIVKTENESIESDLDLSVTADVGGSSRTKCVGETKNNSELDSEMDSLDDSLSTSHVVIPKNDNCAENSRIPDVSELADSLSGKENVPEFGSKGDMEDLCEDFSDHYVAKIGSKSRERRNNKPYSKLSPRERKRLEERNSRRAARIRDGMSSFGRPLAPYRAVSIEDHDGENFQNGHRQRGNSNSSNSSEPFSEDELEDDFDQRELDEIYEDMYTEHMNTKPKTDLVAEYLDLEDKVEALEESLRKSRLRNQWTKKFDVEAELEKIRVFRMEIEKLSHQNDLLQTENDELRIGLSNKA